MNLDGKVKMLSYPKAPRSPSKPMKACLFPLLVSTTLAMAKPNVVFIIADDLGYGDLSCYGQKNFQTPHIDALAAGGIRFTDHYSGATVCAPSRACLMTGKDTGHAAIRGNGSFNLPESETTVATLLRKAGYRTAMIGKSCVSGNTQDAHWPEKHGFTYFYGTTSHKDAHYRYPKFVYENTQRIELSDNHLHTGTQYDLDLYTEQALKWLGSQNAENPFFLLLSLPVPHASIVLPGERPSSTSEHYTQVADPKASYAKLMRLVDDTVGQVVARLDESGLKNDTLIVFTSDNGPHSEGGYHPRMHQSSGPLRGHKRDLYEGGIRVPFIAHWPGSIRPGRVSGHVSAFWDFLPTVCELIGTAAPDDIQGISYLPTLMDRGQQRNHEFLYWESHETAGRRALREGNWKLVQSNVSKPDATKVELFDLGKDPSEADDVADRHPELLEKLVAKMRQARVTSELFPYPSLDH